MRLLDTETLSFDAGIMKKNFIIINHIDNQISDILKINICITFSRIFLYTDINR